MSDEPENLAEALDYEINRNRELLDDYKQIPTGAFGAHMIDRDIRSAVAALASGDVIQMLQAYSAMKNNE